MKKWAAEWLRHWATKLDGRKVLTLDKADQYRVEIGHGWVKVTSLVDGKMHMDLPPDTPVSFTAYGAGGSGGSATVHGSGTAVGGAGGRGADAIRPAKPEPRLPDPFRRPRTSHDFTDPHDMGEGR